MRLEKDVSIINNVVKFLEKETISETAALKIAFLRKVLRNGFRLANTEDFLVYNTNNNAIYLNYTEDCRKIFK